jgi:hypothetical protein
MPPGDWTGSFGAAPDGTGALTEVKILGQHSRKSKKLATSRVFLGARACGCTPTTLGAHHRCGDHRSDGGWPAREAHELRCYTVENMYARKLYVDVLVGGERRPCPLEWLDSFSMRNFTAAAEFDDTLPTAEGRMEASLRVDPSRLATAMGEWFTKRGKGNGQPVVVEIRQG